MSARRTTPGRMSSRTSRMEARAAVPGMAGAGEERWRDYRLGSREPWSLAADSWKCLRAYTIGMCCIACWLRLLFITSSSVLFSPRQSQGRPPRCITMPLKRRHSDGRYTRARRGRAAASCAGVPAPEACDAQAVARGPIRQVRRCVRRVSDVLSDVLSDVVKTGQT